MSNKQWCMCLLGLLLIFSGVQIGFGQLILAIIDVLVGIVFVAAGTQDPLNPTHVG